MLGCNWPIPVLTCRIEVLEHRAEHDNERMATKLEPESGYVLGEGPDAVVISASEARRLRRDDIHT